MCQRVKKNEATDGQRVAMAYGNHFRNGCHVDVVFSSRRRGFAICVLQNIADSTPVAIDAVDSANLARTGIICKSMPFLSQTEII